MAQKIQIYQTYEPIYFITISRYNFPFIYQKNSVGQTENLLTKENIDDLKKKKDLIAACKEGILKAQKSLENSKKLRQRIRMTAEAMKRFDARETELHKIERAYTDLFNKLGVENAFEMKEIETELKNLSIRFKEVTE